MLEGLLEGENEEHDDKADEKPRASIDQLKKKQRVTKTVSLVVSDDDGEPQEVSLLFRGISAAEYDRLISKFPPRPQDKKQGYTYNPDKFGPHIIAATCIDPEMSVEDVEEIWESDEWNRGERLLLLMAAIEVCTAGLDARPMRRVSV